MKRAVVLWLATVVTVAMGSAWASAQIDPPIKVDPPILMTGSDIGFILRARQGGKAVGKLMVRIDGKWVEADFTIIPVR